MKSNMKMIRGWLAGLMLVSVCFAAAQAAPPSELDKAKTAIKTSAAEKAGAVKTLAEKVAAEKAAATAAAAAKTAAEKATAEKVAAEKAVAEKIAAEKAAAAQLVTAKAAADKAAVDARNAQGAALTAKAAADKARSQKAAAAAKATAAEKAATAKAVAAKTVADKATAEKAAADKALAERTAGDQNAATALANAVKAVAAAKAVSAKATAEKVAAEKAAVGKTDAEKVAAEKALAATVSAAGKTQAALVAAEKAQASATAAAGKAAAEKAAAAKVVAAKAAVAQTATAALAAANKAAADAKTAAQKPAAERVAAEKAAVEKAAALKAAIANSAVTLTNARGGLQPLSADAWDYAKARHLLVRSGFGGTAQEVAKLHALGLHAAVDYVVDFDKQPAVNIAFDGSPPDRPDPFEGKYSTEVRNRINTQRTNRENAQLARLRLWWLRRMVQSPRPLQEKLTLFWHGHFATQHNVVRNSYGFYLQNQLFRDNATGNFGALLYGITHDPVMIRFLNNNDNYKGHPNENLAREIMELFALGLDEGYTEKDIQEAARALTGYNFDHYASQFRYIDSQHDKENKTIFGKTGNWSGDDLVRLILEHPATARYIGGKLFNFFVYQDPDSATVDRLASMLRANNYELAPLMKNLFLSEQFYSPRAMGTQIKSPVQLTVGMLRDFGIKDVSDYRALDGAIQGMGQTLFQPPDVKGWRLGRAWIDANRVFIRYNSTASLLRSVVRPGTNGVDVVAVLEGKNLKTSAEVVDALVKTCFVGALSEEKRKQLIDYLGTLPAESEWAKQRNQINARLQALLILMLSTPDYQMT